MGIIDNFLNMRESLDTLIRPEAIFYLPMPFMLSPPARFVLYKDRVDAKGREEAWITMDNIWLDEKTGRYYSADRPYDNVIQAKIRPFLIVSRLTHRQSKCILGLPITTVTEEMQNTPAFINALRQNRIRNFHLLDPKNFPEMRLDHLSMVVIATPFVLPIVFFTHPLGHVCRKDWKNITGKLHRFFDHCR
jgi:hypothetical protein